MIDNDMHNINKIDEINEVCYQLMEKYRIYRVISDQNDKIFLLEEMDRLMLKYEMLKG